MQQLVDLAQSYRNEADRCPSLSRARRDALAMAYWLAEAVANRDPHNHHATYATSPHLTMRWIRRHGYEVAITGAGAGPECLGLILQRGDELLIAPMPARLHWDGHRITVQP